MVSILAGDIYNYIQNLKVRAAICSEEGRFGEAEELWKVVGELEDILSK